MARTPLAESRVPGIPFHPFYALAPPILIVWFVALAGVAASTKKCGTSEACSTSYGLEWTIVVLEFFVLAVAIALVPTRFCSNCRHLLATLLAILATLVMQTGHETLVVLQQWDAVFDYYDASSYKRAVQVDAAGAILLAILNLLLIVYLLLEINTADTAAAEVVKTVQYVPDQQAGPQAMQYATPQQAAPQAVQYATPQHAAPQAVQYAPPQQAAPQAVQYAPPQQAGPQAVQYAAPQQAAPQVVQYAPDQQAGPQVVHYVPEQQQQQQQQPPTVAVQGPSNV